MLIRKGLPFILFFIVLPNSNTQTLWEKKLAWSSLFIFGFLLCKAQDSIVFKNGRTIVGTVASVGKTKVTYTVPPDTAQKVVSNWRLKYIHYQGGTQFNFTQERSTVKPSLTDMYLTADFGFSVPSINYRDGIAGTYFGIGASYYFNNHIGIAAKIGEDLNGTGLSYISDNYWGGFYIFKQYLAGISYRTGGKPSYPWVDFVGLFGLCTASSPVYEQGTGITGITTNTPGNGTGYGGYLGLDFTNSAMHLCSFTFGIGVTAAAFSYPDYSSAFGPYSQNDPRANYTTTTVTKSTLKTSLALYQMHFALNFRVKKSTR